MANRRNELRHLVLERLSDQWPRTPSGKLVKGFWPIAADYLARIEGPQAPEGPELQVWWFKHRRICSGLPERFASIGAISGTNIALS